MNSTRLGIMLVVSGPSGAGKSTLVARLRQEHPELRFSVSCTTRPPRPGEQDHVDYHFLSGEAFAAHVADHALLEHATVHGHRYGTLRSEVAPWLEAGHDVILDIDVQGARQMAARVRDDRLVAQCLERVFIAPPDPAELERRLRARNTEDETTVQRRLARAREEMAAWREYDFLVVNDDLSRAVATMSALLDALSCRTRRLEERHHAES